MEPLVNWMHSQTKIVSHQINAKPLMPQTEKMEKNKKRQLHRSPPIHPRTMKCYHGNCSNDAVRLISQGPQGIFFIPFPRPKVDRRLCRIWIEACNRPGFTIEQVNRNTYLCSKHFVGGRGPTCQFPLPLKAENRAPEKVITGLNSCNASEQQYSAENQLESKVVLKCNSLNSTLDQSGILSKILSDSKQLYTALLQQLPESWVISYSDQTSNVTLCKIMNERVALALDVDSHLHFSIIIFGRQLPDEHKTKFPETVVCAYEILNILSSLEFKWKICCGNGEETLDEQTEERAKNMINSYYYEHSTKAYHHGDCELLVSFRSTGRCNMCRKMRQHLFSARKALDDDMKCSPVEPRINRKELRKKVLALYKNATQK